MKWKIGKHRKEDEEKKKPSSSSSSSSWSSSSSSSAISHLLSLSWISKLKPKRNTNANSNRNPNPKLSKQTVYSPPQCRRRLPETNPRYASPTDLDRFVSARFPPPAPDAPHRLSLGDYEGGLQRRTMQGGNRRRHHHSVGDFELTTLGHLIPFSTQSRTLESDSGTEGSADSDLDCVHRRATKSRLRLRRSKIRRRIEDSDRRHDPDSTDDLPQRSPLGGKIQRRARAKVRVHSPRQVAMRAKEKAAAAARRRPTRAAVAEEEKKVRGLERFAVVKRSRDPQWDFMESMVEMICEKGIGQPDELESLLACYLALNAEEHHDVIVNVFRHVWFQLIRTRFASQH